MSLCLFKVTAVIYFQLLKNFKKFPKYFSLRYLKQIVVVYICVSCYMFLDILIVQYKEFYFMTLS